MQTNLTEVAKSIAEQVLSFKDREQLLLLKDIKQIVVENRLKNHEGIDKQLQYSMSLLKEHSEITNEIKNGL